MAPDFSSGYVSPFIKKAVTKADGGGGMRIVFTAVLDLGALAAGPVQRPWPGAVGAVGVVGSGWQMYWPLAVPAF